MLLSEWREFPSAPCLAGGGNLMTVRVSMLLKSRESLTCFRACFLPGRAKDLSAPRYTQLDRKQERLTHYVKGCIFLQSGTIHCCGAGVIIGRNTATLSALQSGGSSTKMLNTRQLHRYVQSSLYVSQFFFT